MREFLLKLFDTSDFPARWYCGNWSDFLGWMHIASDIAISIAYFAIPLVLVYFVRRRKDVPFTRIFWLFAAFIMACGLVHLTEACIFWYPVYRVSGLLKLITALVSWTTVLALIRITPNFLHLPSIAASNDKLRHEVAQRKKTEAELRQAKERQDAILTATRSIIWTTDRNGAFTSPQPTWERYTGQAWEEYQGFGWASAVHEQDRSHLLEQWSQAIESGDAYRASGRLWHQATQEYRRFVVEAVAVRNPDGTIREWVGTVDDVERQLQMESTLGSVQSELAIQKRELELIYETAPVGLCLIDRELRYLRINEKLAEINGLPLDAHLGRRVDELLGELSEVVSPIYRQVFETKMPVLDVEVVGKTPASQESRVWLTSFFPLHLPSEKRSDATEVAEDEVTAVTTTVQEITDRKKQEQLLQESERAAQAASRAKSTFLANISHEIRTPMASILGYADLLLANLADAENRSCAATIKRNGQYLLELINDILDLSRIEAGKFDVDFENCDLPRLIGDVQSLMQVRAVEKNIQLEVAFEGKVPRTIQTDPKRLRQVLINLVGNAIKFTEEGQVRIRVKLLRQPAAACLEIAVEDTGIGIDESQRAQLFEPFSQGELTISRRYGGSGLGLAISQRLMELLHGSIEYSSQVGKGTTFLLHLPIGSADTLHLVEPDLLMEPSQDEPSDRQPTKLDCRLLIVDDRRDVRYVSQHFLQKAGATVTTAEDGLQAVSLVLDSISKGCPFDLILMDMQMPEMDGLQATAKLRSAGVKTPIIALTAGAMRGDRERYLSSGCDDYIAKPIEAHQLIAKVAFYTQTLSLEEVQQMRSLRQAKSQHKPAPDAQTAEDDTSRELD